MTHLLHNPRLLRKYIDKKQEQLREILEELQERDLEDPARFRLLELMLYLQKGIPELEEVYANISRIEAAGSPDTDRSHQTTLKDVENLSRGSSATPVMTEAANQVGIGRTMAELSSKLDAVLALWKMASTESMHTAHCTSETDSQTASPRVLITEKGAPSVKEQSPADWDQLSKGVREGKTVDLLYKQLCKMRSMYRNRGLSSTQIREQTREELAIAWEWIDRIRDQERRSAFLDLTEWEDGARFIFLQIATLYEYAPHLKRKPTGSTVREWRKAYLGHEKHRTLDGRRPQ